jgi:hypothetical protein
LRIAVEKTCPLSMMMTVLEWGVVFDAGVWSELLILIKCLRPVSSAIGSEMALALVLRISRRRLGSSAIALLANRSRIISTEEERWLDLVDVHTLCPSRGVIAKPLRTIDL